MLAAFCLRLAWGLVAALVILPAAVVPPRFYRVQFLTALGLLAVAAYFLHEAANAQLWVAFGIAMVVCLAGSVVWHLREAPLGKSVVILALLASTGVLALAVPMLQAQPGFELYADFFSSGLLLGAATTAMLMGHSYLIAPAMSMTPLLRLLALLVVALLVRAGLAGFGLWQWTAQAPSANLEAELVLWLVVRWLVGFIGPLVLGWLAWETARIRSTQSATGILYVVVILCFLGELTSQLLLEKIGHVV